MKNQKDEFILNYATTFLATMAANEYSDICARGEHDRLKERAPIEDAFHIASELWDFELFQDEIKNHNLIKIPFSIGPM